MPLAPVLSASLLLVATVPQVIPRPSPPTADAVLLELKAGNERFVRGRRTRSLLSAEDPRLRRTLARGQNPSAVIVTSSDSRVETSFIFDQELGRLFTIREAGNSPDTLGLASAEYAVAHLGCPLIVVLGHTSCGAVAAVADAKGAALPGNFAVFQQAMAGLLESTPQLDGEDPRDFHNRLAEVNAIQQARRMLQRSGLLAEQAAAGKLKILPAIYELSSGRVIFLSDPPPRLKKADPAADPLEQ